MKLRNKKTGKIYNACSIWFGESIDDLENTEWKTLKEFCKDWEDVKEPEEPLIKDEKIRKAVRAWAEACRVKYATYKQSSNEFYDPDTRGKFAIKFTLKPIEVWLDDGKCYTIDELCGEEE